MKLRAVSLVEHLYGLSWCIVYHHIAWLGVNLVRHLHCVAFAWRKRILIITRWPACRNIPIVV